MPSLRERLTETLIKHEGLRLKPYRDSVGKLTIGVGRNLDDRGITPGEAHYLLKNDIEIAYLECHDVFPWFASLNDDRKVVLISMAFNMGMPKLRGFHKMLRAIALMDYDTAAMEMLKSQWAEQVGKRAFELATLMRATAQVIPIRPDHLKPV